MICIVMVNILTNPLVLLLLSPTTHPLFREASVA